ncbi:hypothetical protein [Hymenobacter crusticola]|uniref:Outer membrane protein beta-barrel domain-containing protein n=1 Tax=Hymenobacter crusticola TaxID=1770526 RepID=A0A243W6Y1_9BACT|nr:hypothetical protein [Hymenobacter crusticola]OUJ70022.1 hypothetical protein BXP70_25460 [Hymenobacter crusticola]
MLLLRSGLLVGLLLLSRPGRAQGPTPQDLPPPRSSTAAPQPAPLVPPHRWSVVAAAQAHGSRHVVADQTLVSPRLLLRPTVGLAGLLGVRYGLRRRLGIEAGVSVRSDGVSIASVADYRGGRYESVQVSTIWFNSPQLQVLLLYQTSPSQAGHCWILQGGADVISRRYLNLGGYGTGLSTNAGQPPATLTASQQLVQGSVWRLGLQGCIGREWHVSPAQFVGLRLVGRVGLQEFNRWQLRYTFTEDGIQRHYQNQIHTKLGYVGLQTWYRFQG